MPEEHIPTLAELRERHTDPAQLDAAARAAVDLHIAAMSRIHTDVGDGDLTASQQRRWDAHNTAEADLRQFVGQQAMARVAQSRSHYDAVRFGGPGPDGNGDDPTMSAARSVALRQADDANRRGWLPDYARDKMASLLEGGSESQRSAAAAWAVSAGAPAYRTAFLKIAGNPNQGHLEWTPEEQDAFRAVQRWKSQNEERTALAMAGYVLPTSLDPAIMISNDGSNNPLRRLARVVPTTTSSWRGIASAGATAEWKTEGSQAADGTPTVSEVAIPVFLADVDAIYSYEVGQDGTDFANQLMIVIRDAMDNLQATAFTTGNGTTAPQGIITGLAGTASEINTTGSEAIVATDATALQNALPARFSADASWLSHIATKNTFAFFETTNGALMFPELRQNPPMLLGKPWYELSNMDGSINAAATANNYVMVYGDVRRGFTIVDHVGATAEILPGYGANNRPTAQRHMFVTSRHGSEVVLPQALRLLDVPTTA